MNAKPVSNRCLPLFYNEESRKSGKIVVTGEDYMKWYDLYLVFPSGGVTAMDYEVLEGFADTIFIDHDPNPEAVIAFAEKYGYHVDKGALEAMKNSWEEYK